MNNRHKYQPTVAVKVRRSVLVGAVALVSVAVLGAGLNLPTIADDLRGDSVSQEISSARRADASAGSGSDTFEPSKETVELTGVERIGFSLPCLEWRGWNWRTGVRWGIKLSCAFSIGWNIGKEIYRRALGPWIDRCWPNCEFTLW